MSRSIWIVSAMTLFVAGFAFADEPKILTASRAQQPPVLDGRLDDACWQSAERATGFSNLTQPEVPAKDQTACQVVFDDDQLYIGIECLESRMDLLKRDLAAMRQEYNYALGEVLEIFLDPSQGKRFASHFLIAANGATAMDNGDALQVGGLPFRAAVLLGKDRFFVEVAIPLAILHLTPQAGATWGFNVNRARAVERETSKGPNDNCYSSWQNTGGAFNLPARFGRLKLDLDTSPFWYDVKLLEAAATRLQVGNQTGRPAKLKASLTLAAQVVTQTVSLNAGATKSVEFPVPSTNARLTVELRERSSDRVVYQGATTAVDRTPPAGPAPNYSARDLASRYIAFTRDYNSPIRRTAQPQPSEIGQPLEIYASPGEYEPVLLGVRTLDRELRRVSVRVRGDLDGPGRARISRDRVDVRVVTETKHWTAQGQEFRWLPWLVEKELPATLAPNRAYYYFITAHVPPETPPGTYTGAVELRAAGCRTRLVPLTVTVWPIKLQQPADMCWGYYYDSDRLPANCRTLDYQRRVFRDMVAHGMNNLTVYGNLGSGGAVDQSGGPQLPVMQTMNDALAAGLAQPTIPVMTMGFSTVAPAVREAARAHRWPTLLQYAYDEPNDAERIAQARAGLTALKREHPEVKTVTSTSESGLQSLGDLYDVWVVEIGSVCSPLVAAAKTQGKLIWAYNCADSKADLAANRLLSGLWSWKTGVNGIWQWAYTDNRELAHRTGSVLRDVFADDPDALWPYYFHHPDDCIPAFSYTLAVPDGPVPGLGHIGRREGVDDYRYAYTLSRQIEAVRARPSSAAQAAAAQAAQVLAEIIGRFSTNPWDSGNCGLQTMSKIAPALAAGEWHPDAHITPADYTRFRRQIAEQIIQLQEIPNE